MNKPTAIDINKLLDIGIALSKEKNADTLLEMILIAAMDVMNCDGGTLYIRKNDMLEFKIMITKSIGVFKGGRHEPIDLPPMKIARENVCGYCIVEERIINVPDVYANGFFDFSGPKKMDPILGYKTTSMLVIPMEDDYGDIIGVLQLINAQDEAGGVIPFAQEFKTVVQSLASHAAIRLTTVRYAAEIIGLLDSFVKVISTAIDELSPYNANHSRNMARYAERFMTWLDNNNRWPSGVLREHQILMSIWLHDIGKLVIPLEIMDKESRLGAKIRDIEHRFEIIGLHNHIRLLSGEMEAAEHERATAELTGALRLIREADKAEFLADETLERIKALGETEYADLEGTKYPLLTIDELAALSIRRGTLTDEERELMEKHVSLTAQMLSKMNFPRDYRMVPEWASSHHEYINGSGYPKKLSGDSVSPEVRLITILDVFDALTAVDRPYKPAVSTERAFSILSDMAREGKLDAEILALFKESGAWIQ